MSQISLEIMVRNLPLVVMAGEVKDTPLATGVIDTLVGRAHLITQARWSGLGLCVNLPHRDLPTEEGENNIVPFGTIAVHLGNPRELIIAYGPVEYYVPPNNPALCFIGQIHPKSHDTLKITGHEIWQNGSGTIRFVRI